MQMTKFSLLSILFFGAFAQANGFYVQGDLGYVKVSRGAADAHFLYYNSSKKITEDFLQFQQLSQAVLKQSSSIGYQYDNFRYALDLSFFTNVKFSNEQEAKINRGGYTKTVIITTAKLETKSLGLTAIYDFITDEKFTFFAGTRLGILQSHQAFYFARDPDKGNSVQGGIDATYSDVKKEYNLQIGALFGAKYEITDNVFVTATTNFNYSKRKTTEIGGSIGLGYKF